MNGDIKRSYDIVTLNKKTSITRRKSYDRKCALRKKINPVRSYTRHIQF